MDLDVTPSPAGADREVITVAVHELARAGGAPSRSAWWRAGVAENVGERDGLAERPAQRVTGDEEL